MLRCISNQKEKPNGQEKYSKELNDRMALDVIKGQKTLAVFASEYGVHVNQLSSWRSQLLDAAPDAFTLV